MGKYDDFEEKYGLTKPKAAKPSGYVPGKYDDFEQKYGLLSEDEKRRRDHKKTKSEPFVGPPEDLAGLGSRGFGDAAQDRALGIGAAGLDLMGNLAAEVNTKTPWDDTPGGATAFRGLETVAGLGKAFSDYLPDAIADRAYATQDWLASQRADMAPDERIRSDFLSDAERQTREYAENARFYQSKQEKQTQQEMGKAADKPGFLPTLQHLARNPQALLTLSDSLPSSFAVGGAAGKGLGALTGIRSGTAAVSAQLGTGALVEGAAAGQGAYQSVMEAPEEVLGYDPVYRSLLEQTEGDSTRAREIMAEMARTVGSSAGATTSLLLQGLGQKFGANVVEDSLIGRISRGATGSRTANAALGGVKETISEGLQGGANKLSENVGALGGGSGWNPFEGIGGASVLEAAAGGPTGVLAGAVQKLPTPKTPKPILPDTGVPAFDAGKATAASMQTDEAASDIKPPKPRIRVTPEGVIPTVQSPVDPDAFAPEAEVEAARQRTAVLEADVARQERQSSVLADLRGSKDRKVAEAVKGLYDTGRLKFYGDTQALPEGANSATDKGYFDGKTLYLNEAKLGKGEATSVALHEVKHYMDSVAKQNGEAVRERSLRRILGDEGNARVNERITQLAQTGNKVAQEAIADATAGATVDGQVDPAIFQDEVGAYFLQRAQQARESKTSLGRAGVVLRDMVSYAKAKLADFGIDLALSDNDILYLGRQLAPKALKVDAPSAPVARASVTTDGLEVEEMDFDPSLFPQREEYLNNNASGESEASLEAINRVKEEKELGRTRLLLDKDGTVRPLEGVQAVDTFARDGQVIVQRGVGNKEWTVISSDPKLSNELIEGRLNAAQSKIKEATVGRASKDRPAQPKKVEKVTKAPPAVTERAPPKDTGVAGITKDIGPTRLSAAVDKVKDKMPQQVRQAWDVVLSPTQGKKADVAESMENAKSKASLAMIKGDQAANRLRNAIKGAGKKTPKAQRPQVEREVTKLVQDASSKDAAARTTAREVLKNQHPAVYAEYMDVRNNIKRMGLEIRKSILESGRRLTNADLRNIKAIEANMETYVSRAYRADIKGDVQKDWQKKTVKAWEKETKKGKIESEGAKVFEDAKDYLRNQLNIGTFEQVLEAAEEDSIETLDRLKALHEAWVDPEHAEAYLPAQATEEDRAKFVETAIAELKKVRQRYIDQGTYDAKLEQKAVDLTKEVLKKGQEGGSPLAQFFRGARRNNTVIMQRERIPPQLRKLWGEIDEPVISLATTFMRQGRFLADSKMLDELYDIGKGRYFDSPANATGTNFTEKLSGKGLGPLGGMMATPDFQRAVEAHLFQTASLEAFLTAMEKGAISSGLTAGAGMSINFMSKLGGTVKSMMVIYNPEQYVMNVIGSVATPIMSGFLPGQGLARGVQAAAGMVTPALRTKLNKRAEEMFAVGMHESGQVGEIQEANRALLMKELTGGTGVISKTRILKDTTTDLFVATDNAGRMGTAYAWQDWLTEYYKAKGETRSEEQIAREAAYRTKRRSVTFSRVPALAKALEKSALTMYFPYFVETYRAIGTAFTDSLADFETGRKEGGKAGRMKMAMGARGAAGAAAALVFNRQFIQAMSRAAAVGLVAMGLAPDGEDEDKEKLSRIQKGMEDRFQGKTLTLLEVTPEGRYVFLEGERMSMLDPVLSPMNKLIDGDVDGAWKDFSQLMFNNTLLTRLGKNVLRDENPRPTLANTVPETYAEAQVFFQEHFGMRRNTTNAVSNIAELFVPSVLKTSMAAAFDEQDFGPEVNTLVGMGVKVAVYDPKKALKGARFEYGEKVGKLRDEFKDVFSAVKVSDQTLRKTYQSAIVEEFEAYTRLQELIDSARAVDMPDDEIRSYLGKGGAGLTKVQIAAALDGEFRPTVISERVRKEAKAKELEEAKDDPEKEAAIEDKYERIESIIEELNSQNELQSIKE